MAINPQIPLMVDRQPNLADIYMQAQGVKNQNEMMDMRREQFEWEKEQAEFDKLAKLDAAQREQVEKGLKDISAAVQWADSPDKWQVVQQNYARFDPSVTSIPFENREQVLVKLGKMGDYLTATKKQFLTLEPGGSLYSGNAQTGAVQEVIRANDGNQPFGAPVSQAPAPQMQGRTLEFSAFKGATAGLNELEAAKWLQEKGMTVRISSDEEFYALPTGAPFIAPDGTTRRKP